MKSLYDEIGPTVSAAKLPVIAPGLRHLLCLLMQDRPEKMQCGGKGEEGETYVSLEEEKIVISERGWGGGRDTGGWRSASISAAEVW